MMIDIDWVRTSFQGGVLFSMQVDLTRRHCFPVYWNGENRRVLRGHWFARKGGLDWLPLREDVAEQLEIAYRSQVCLIIQITFLNVEIITTISQMSCCKCGFDIKFGKDIYSVLFFFKLFGKWLFHGVSWLRI